MKTQTLSRLVGVICAVVTVACLFLPLFVGTEDYLDYLDYYPEDYVDERTGINVHETASVSPVDYGRLYGRIFDGAEAAVYIGLTAFLAGAAVLTLLFAALNKPVAMMIFDILTFTAMRIMVYDLDGRGVCPGAHWQWGISFYLLHIFTVLALAAAIWMLVTKIRSKRL